MAKWIVFVAEQDDTENPYTEAPQLEMDLRSAIEDLGLTVEYVMKAPTEDTEVIVNRILK